MSGRGSGAPDRVIQQSRHSTFFPVSGSGSRSTVEPDEPRGRGHERSGGPELMTSKRILSTLLPLALLAVLSCSKTQDTAPEQRIFGSPPTIETVDSNLFNPQAPASCNFTDIVTAFVCQFGYLDVQPQKGPGWANSDNPFSSVPTTEAGVFIQGTYTELSFVAKVTDPASTAQQSNILLMSASYVPPDSPNEVTLVLFHDGSQVGIPIPE